MWISSFTININWGSPFYLKIMHAHMCVCIQKNTDIWNVVFLDQFQPHFNGPTMGYIFGLYQISLFFCSGLSTPTMSAWFDFLPFLPSFLPPPFLPVFPFFPWSLFQETGRKSYSLSNASQIWASLQIQNLLNEREARSPWGRMRLHCQHLNSPSFTQSSKMGTAEFSTLKALVKQK